MVVEINSVLFVVPLGLGMGGDDDLCFPDRAAWMREERKIYLTASLLLGVEGEVEWSDDRVLLFFSDRASPRNQYYLFVNVYYGAVRYDHIFDRNTRKASRDFHLHGEPTASRTTRRTDRNCVLRYTIPIAYP